MHRKEKRQMKVLFVLDTVRKEYLRNNQIDLKHSSDGQALHMIAYDKGALNLQPDQVKVVFGYPRVPDQLPNHKMKPITRGQISKYRPELYQQIIDFDPDLILSFGNTAVTALYGKGGISNLRGIPTKTEIIDPTTNEVHHYWVLPTYGFIDVRLNPNKSGEFNSDIDLAKKYLQQGEVAFQHKNADYDLVMDFDKVKAIFTDLLGLPPLAKPKYPMVAFDIEANTLEGFRPGAKMLSISMSWKTHQGVFIPVYHRESPFDDLQKQQLVNWINQLLADKRIFKLLYNAGYDITFIMENYGLQNANRVIDIGLMSYVGVSEESGLGGGLKSLAYRYTDMGGYDNELDSYKKQYLKDHQAKWTQAMEERKAQTGEKYYKNQYQAPVNEIDGSKFNYDWIPVKVLGTYAAGDSDATFRIYEALLPSIKEYKPWINLIFNYYPALVNVLCRLMANGVQIDTDYIKEVTPYYNQELDNIIAKIHEICPEVNYLEQQREDLLNQAQVIKKQVRRVKDRTPEQLAIIKAGDKLKTSRKEIEAGKIEKTKFNPGSTTDKQELLFNLLGYDIPHDIKENKPYLVDAVFEKGLLQDQVTYKHYKTNKEVLEYLVAHEHSQVAQLLIDYSALYKLSSSYLHSYPAKLDPQGRLHPHFNYAGTVTLTNGYCYSLGQH